jgi:superfamily II DNA/RNA helicase
MNSTLKRWIAQSESLQAFIELHIPKEEQSAYQFLSKYDDFYISLMNYCMDILNDTGPTIDRDEYLLIAKGLEIFSLKGKCDNFKYIDKQNNILFAASLYYLADYTASSVILALLYTGYNTDIDIFISNILRKNLRDDNIYTKKICEFFITGNFHILEELSDLIEDKNIKSFNEDIDAYVSSVLAKKLLKKIKEDNIWGDLLKTNDNIEYWKPYVLHCINKKHPVINFFPSQRLALNKGVLSGNTISLQMPTSAGKTFLTEVIIYNQVKTDPLSKVLYLTPYRSLASELKKTLAKQLKSLAINASVIYGGNLPSIDDHNDINTSNVLFSTPEKFMALQNIYPYLDNDYKTIICDEGHLLDDTTRGLEYELLLSRLKANKDKKRFIFISAIIPNLETINEWLGGTADSTVKSDYRPTQLDFAFLKKIDNRPSYYLDFNPGLKTNFILNGFLNLQDLSLKKDKERYIIKSQKGITATVALKAIKQGQVLVFAPHKRGKTGVEGIVEEIIKQLSFTNNSLLRDDTLQDIITELSDYFALIFGTDYLLVNAVKYGILYHHADFPQFIREMIEDSISEAGFKLIVCTNTLTEGVNLPIRTIVVHSTKRYNPKVKGNYEDINVRDLKNLAGRAGRAGKETKGLIIVPHANNFNSILDVMNETSNEKIYGNLYNNIIQPITKLLIRENIKLDDELLAGFEHLFPSVIESIDISLLELLSEEVGSDELMQIVFNLVTNTFSYFQSDDNEKDTLARVFTYRANILLPYINSGDFKVIKGSGASISLYKKINEIFDFKNEIWFSISEALSEKWLTFILDEGIFKINNIIDSIKEDSCKISGLNFEIVKTIIINWMKGCWYSQLSDISNISVNDILKLITTVFQFEFQNVLSSVIRTAEIKNNDKEISAIILNWTKMLQYGIDSQLKIDLLELGLTDRVAILFLNDYCNSLGYNHQTKGTLKQYINMVTPSIRSISPVPIPNIAFKNLIDFMDKITKDNTTQRTL